MCLAQGGTLSVRIVAPFASMKENLATLPLDYKELAELPNAWQIRVAFIQVLSPWMNAFLICNESGAVVGISAFQFFSIENISHIVRLGASREQSIW